MMKEEINPLRCQNSICSRVLIEFVMIFVFPGVSH